VGEGVYSFGSGPILDNELSSLQVQLDVAQAGKIFFDYRVSSEASYDYLRFYIDGAPVSGWSGEHSWTQASFDVVAGMRTFEWIYEKDAFVSSGDDRAFLDRIIFPALVPTLQLTTETLPDWTVGLPYNHQLEASGSLGQVSWTDKNDDLATSGLTLSPSGILSGTPLTTDLVQFTALVEDGAGIPDEKLLSFSINDVLQITSDVLPGANRNYYYEQQLQAVGGTAPITWSDALGDLTGTGLTISLAGLLSGTPGIRGTVLFTASLEDAAGAVDSKEFELNIDGGCCEGIVGDANYDGGYEPTIGDISVVIDLLFISGQLLVCYGEADVNLSGGIDPTLDDISIGDISTIIDNLFISNTPLPECP
jgi:hypothetical protein